MGKKKSTSISVTFSFLYFSYSTKNIYLKQKKHYLRKGTVDSKHCRPMNCSFEHISPFIYHILNPSSMSFFMIRAMFLEFTATVLFAMYHKI